MTCPVKPDKRPPIQGWEVAVSVNGENILTIGHNHLSGIENIADYADAVRICARHLMSFIGDDDEQPNKEISK